ncbi:MAG: NAD(P)-dependent oxidoreductase [Betaproteobacteria bacterium]|nr:NAD(P)-dependent oxidoreductase [Betaproteobacteria bacterium]MDH3436243.1 NAD(P)-dependent oxidoreductase [Betaproteobacteria bacterium]
MSTDRQPVGIVGLGLIGTALAERLIGAGFTVHGYDIIPERCARLTELGGITAASVQDIGRTCNPVVLAVFDTDQVEGVVEGAGGMASLGLSPGQTVICTSTCEPDRIFALAERAARSGIRFLEFPISGNSNQITLGNGVGLAGGEVETMETVAPVLDAICSRRYYLGRAGAAGRAKLAVNLVGGLNRAVLAEGLAFAEALGLELDSFLEVLKASAAYNRAMDTRGHKMIHGDFAPHGKVFQSRKDFALMQKAAERAGQTLPLATVYIDLIEGCLANGEAELDNSAIIREVRRRRRR